MVEEYKLCRVHYRIYSGFMRPEDNFPETP